jgi:hypothetical protein
LKKAADRSSRILVCVRLIQTSHYLRASVVRQVLVLWAAASWAQPLAKTVEQEQRFEGQREGESDRQFAARLQREIDAGLRPPAPPPAPPQLPTDQQLFTLAAQPNGYGLLENLKQRLLQDQQFPEADRKAAADNMPTSN